MKGFPKHINTKKDVKFLFDKYPKETKTFLKRKLTEVKQWLVAGKLKDGNNGKTDKQHKIVEVKDEKSGKVTERYQYEYKDDPNCQLFRLDLTVAEAERMINDKPNRKAFEYRQKLKKLHPNRNGKQEWLNGEE
jgi:hypothetical protein